MYAVRSQIILWQLQLTATCQYEQTHKTHYFSVFEFQIKFQLQYPFVTYEWGELFQTQMSY